MPIPDKDKLFATLEKLGEQEVRIRLAQGIFAHYKHKLIELWLSQKEKGRQTTVYAKAFHLLQVIYEQTRDREEPIFVEKIGNKIGLSDEDTKAAWRYLRDKNLIDTFNIEYTARINAYGVDVIEDARLHPDKPLQLFPSVTYNRITIQNSPSSVIQQGGAHSNMTQTVSYGPEDLGDLRRLVEVFDKYLDDLALDASAKRKAMAQVGTIKAQLEDDPDPVIVKQAGRTLRNITEGAIGSLIATAAQPTVWATAATLLAKLFGGF